MSQGSIQYTQRGRISSTGAFVVHLSLGALFCFPAIRPYIASYLKLHDHAHFTHQDDTLLGIAYGAMALTLPLGAMLESATFSALPTLLGGLIGCAGIIAATAMPQDLATTWVLICLGGVVGAGAGLAYMPTVATALRWMPQRAGLACGLVTSGSAIGAIALGLLCRLYVNPSNLDAVHNAATKRYFYPKEVADRVPGMLLLLGSVVGGLAAIGSFLLSHDGRPAAAPSPSPSPPRSAHRQWSPRQLAEDPQEEEEYHYRSSSLTPRSLGELLLPEGLPETLPPSSSSVGGPPPISTKHQEEDREPLVELSLCGVLQHGTTWCALAVVVLTSLGSTFTTVLYDEVHDGAEHTFVGDEGFFQVYSVVGFACAAVGRVGTGLLCDRLGWKSVFIGINMVQAVLVACFTVVDSNGSNLFFAIYRHSLTTVAAGNMPLFCLGAQMIHGLPSVGVSGALLLSGSAATMVLAVLAASPLQRSLTELPLSICLGALCFTGTAASYWIPFCRTPGHHRWSLAPSDSFLRSPSQWALQLSPSDHAKIVAQRFLASTLYRCICLLGLLLNLALLIMMVLVDTDANSAKKTWYSDSVLAFDLISSTVLVLLGTEICVTAIAQWGAYFHSPWNWLDITVLVVCLVVLILTLNDPAAVNRTTSHERSTSVLDIVAIAFRYLMQVLRLLVLCSFERNRQQETITRNHKVEFEGASNNQSRCSMASDASLLAREIGSLSSPVHEPEQGTPTASPRPSGQAEAATESPWSHLKAGVGRARQHSMARKQGIIVESADGQDENNWIV